jgi:hypothetical protein
MGQGINGWKNILQLDTDPRIIQCPVKHNIIQTNENYRNETQCQEKVKDLLNQIQHILVINKFYVAPVDFFFCIFFLFHFKYMLQIITSWQSSYIKTQQGI